MSTKIKKSIVAGIVGTAIMTIVMIVAPMMGMPKMSPPNMLADMMGMPIMIGWIMHFMIGIIFALAYTYLCILKNKINSIYLKGAVFGLIVFVFAQIMMLMMSAMMPAPAMEDSKMMMVMGSLMGHIIFGITVAKVVGKIHCNCDSKSCANKHA